MRNWGHLSVPRWLFRGGKCQDAKTILLLLALLARARTTEHEFQDRVTGRMIHLDVTEFVIGIRGLSKDLGWSFETVQKRLAQMIEWGWIKRWRVTPKMFVYRMHESFAEILMWSDGGTRYKPGSLEKTWEKYKSNFNRKKKEANGAKR